MKKGKFNNAKLCLDYRVEVGQGINGWIILIGARMLRFTTTSKTISKALSTHFAFSVVFMSNSQIIFPFDALLKDIKQLDLNGQISNRLGKKYLAPLVSEEEKQVQQKRTGIIYGVSRRGLITIPTRFANNFPLWVHYLVDTASVGTYLTSQALNALAGTQKQSIDAMNVTINGFEVIANVSASNFKEVNILGMDYLIARKSILYSLFGSSLQKSNFEIQF